MYEILDRSRRLTEKQIANEFGGKWVYLVDLEGPPFEGFKTAVPAVVASIPFAGKETGIYDKLEEEYNGNTTVWSFLGNTIFGFSEVLIDGD